MNLSSELRAHLYFAGLLLIGVFVYVLPIGDLATIALRNETYSHIFLIPLVSLVLLATHRKKVFSDLRGRPAVGLAVGAGGVALNFFALALREYLSRQTFRNQDVPNDYLTLCMAGLVLWVIGSFIAAYGTQAFKKARFELLFLVFAVPMPMLLLEKVVTSLQHASAEAADLLFMLSGASYHRSGLVFEFSNVAVQVAEQCSGIRSSLSLFILSIVTGHLFLHTSARRVILALAVFPITVIKNALRIMTITILANQVDTRFLTNHWIHSSGGVPFFAVALILLIPLVWMLRKTETQKSGEEDLTSNPTT